MPCRPQVDVSSDDTPLDISRFSDAIGGVMPIIKRCLCCRRASRLAPTQAEIQGRLHFLNDYSHHRWLIGTNAVDLVLQPPVKEYSILDFAKFAEIMQVGYKDAHPIVSKWCEKDERIQRLRELSAMEQSENRRYVARQYERMRQFASDKLHQGKAAMKSAAAARRFPEFIGSRSCGTCEPGGEGLGISNL